MPDTASSKPLGATYRWAVLAIMSLICFAQYYIYDSITPIGTLLKEQLHFTGAEYGLLFSAYSAANVFLLMLLVAGVLVDKLGLKISGILYGFLCFLGAALTAVGAWHGLPDLLGGGYHWLATAFLPGWSPELKVMLLGRTIYGVGAGGTRARRGVPLGWLTRRRAWEGPVDPRGQATRGGQACFRGFLRFLL